MRINPQSAVRGNILLTLIVFTAVLCVLVCSNLSLIGSKSALTHRSMDWNNALPMAEAGIEEALSQLQVAQTTNFSTNGWTASGGNYYKLRTNLVAKAYYKVVIQPTNYQVGIGPTIISTGFVAVPFGAVNYSDPSFASGGGSSGTNTFVHRTVMVTTALTKNYPYAVLSKSTITLNTSYLDSFNSLNPSYSSNGLYNASQSEANAVMATTDPLASDFQVMNGTIEGSVATGASIGNPSIQNGYVGTAAYDGNSANKGTFQAGHVVNNFTTTIPDVTAPFTSGGVLGSGVYNTTNYTYYAGSGNYSTLGALTIGGGQSMVIAGNAVIYVGGALTVSGSGFIYIAPGASLTMYVAGTSCTISGNGVVNGTELSLNCSIDCLPACTTATISGSGAYIGVLNAPEAAVTLSGSSYMAGALVADTVTFSGGMAMHYDEALGNGGKPQYAVLSWQELP